ncbi:MAG: hypothetical protein A2268_01760 [Candidatus Raymondbacteria bacterium RifOxyA12_full_50_37]|uniref:Uncharacterized protein n=1 Tax=Candidatus Raymondbacteria bacterium RIFOXYD12_FULL_49_13 TaxID=1817890 RepID=A0A1F7F9U9_UNCRA|nr:MAG: hypothetical protein A2268_01760 [Candidatus Raymondbacteria bacterium RifOxyA12_full_50_37]OGJ87791.1 MAG: hypothetical protein A2248_07365 [Candidatus Raymondbacteria bacterium RIFOXYA2_FULL_49_16]OGJ95669.1 MAG: hypothetical protein A2453_13360 [Candidatus Raymondbacteria bacterium RIFOXYC2_FULL_50_21]OGK03440.1 MAG: hypothetical protein A2519_15640 [Candidatus Raymondbacteria bacterium RIFOXYD12_FULL_49_13]OGK05075.1 MAG: hypothetical protein A2487_15925 [Candidatus Raymondbacteria 
MPFHGIYILLCLTVVLLFLLFFVILSKLNALNRRVQRMLAILKQFKEIEDVGLSEIIKENATPQKAESTPAPTKQNSKGGK